MAEAELMCGHQVKALVFSLTSMLAKGLIQGSRRKSLVFLFCGLLELSAPPGTAMGNMKSQQHR